MNIVGNQHLHNNSSLKSLNIEYVTDEVFWDRYVNIVIY